MARIAIVTPARAGTRTGNLHTAQRWARMLRGAGHRVSVTVQWDGEPCDLMLALHARRSHESIIRLKQHPAAAPLVVALTGTDLYRDLPASAEARRSLELADRIIVLQEDAILRVARSLRGKTRIVYQSADPAARHAPPADRFRVAVVGHLREEKDPLRTVQAFSLLGECGHLELVQLGAALDPELGAEAVRWMQRDARYRWLGSVPHARALDWIAHSHLLVVSSVMEGGANVICEAARIGTPVLASRVSGNIGMLGRNYPGLFRLFDQKGLALLIRKASENNKYYKQLKTILAARRSRFAPAAERDALNRVVREALKSRK
ncbi:MAG: TIGR04348 family glycosyltransferase [Betaproteobacteria bacterium]|nr:TIGR04348 family glycosyltransferase [Betaproteobacteria bacterium]